MKYKAPKIMQEIVNAVEYDKLKEGIEPTLDQIAADIEISGTRAYPHIRQSR